MSFGASPAAKAGVIEATTTTPPTSKARIGGSPSDWSGRHDTTNRGEPQPGTRARAGPRGRPKREEALEHRGQDSIRGPVPVEEGLDIDDDLLAHVDAALERGRTHMGEQHHLAGAGELDQLRVHRRLVFEHVEARARDIARRNQAHQRVLVDYLAPRGV